MTLIQEKKITAIVRREVASVLRELLSDPDGELVLRRKTVLRLQQSIRSKREGRLKSLDAVLRKYEG